MQGTDWGAVAVVAAVRRKGILAAAAAAVVEQRSQATRPSQELEHLVVGSAVEDSGRSVKVVS